MHMRLFTFSLLASKMMADHGGQHTMNINLKNGQLARAAVNLGISVAGLIVVRFIVQFLPMFQDMGWIVEHKLTVVGAAVILVDAMLLAVLVGFAIQIRAFLSSRFKDIPALGTIAVSLVILICGAIAYTDFKPVTRAWPSISAAYLWGFSLLAAALLIHMMVLFYKNRDRIAALILKQPMPVASPEQPSTIEDSSAAVAGN
ncbi:MAG: hypothetical protein ACM3SW_01440 [Actinomycetota bacterium]